MSGDGSDIGWCEDDLEKLRRLGLQLLVRICGAGRPTGEILTAAEHGVLVCEYDRNTAASLAGFSEVYRRTPSTGFAIRRFTADDSNGEAVLRGSIATRRSFTENRVHLQRVAAGFLCQTVRHFAKTGTWPRRAVMEQTPATECDAPGFLQTLRYASMTVGLLSCLAVNRLLLRRRLRWSVAFARAPWTAVSYSEATVVANPEGSFLADPFVVTKDGRSVLFAEDYTYATGRGTVSAIVLEDGGKYRLARNVIAEQFHLSFPFLFEFGGDLYMVPESHEAGSIRLYRCNRFPDLWEYQHDLMSGVEAADTMILHHGTRWWLLTNIAPPGSDAFDVQLCVFSADSPLSREWQPHPGNPVVTGSEVSRNGGFVRDVDGTILRVRQKQGFNRYGEGYSLARITRLDEFAYEEVFMRSVAADFLPKIQGTHHMHSDGTVTAFDFVRDETID